MSNGGMAEETVGQGREVDSDGSSLIWFAVVLFILVNIAVLIAGGFGPATADIQSKNKATPSAVEAVVQ